MLAPLEQSGEPLFVAFNASSENIEVTLPEWQGVGQWSSVLDTVGNSVLQELTVEPPGTKLGSPPSSVLAFAGKP